jgi:hypothetical protein
VGGFVARTAQKAGVTVLFFFGIALLPALVALPRILADRRVRFLLWVAVFFGIGIAVNAWIFPHYVAPLTAGIYALLIQGIRHLRCWGRRDGTGVSVFRGMAIVCVVLTVVRVAAHPLNIEIGRWPTLFTWYGMEPSGLERARISRDLASRPGPQLAIVRYASGHWPYDEWVYNDADIDRAKVVWAREPDDRSVPADLLRYFHGRSVWLIQPDVSSERIRPYTVADAGAEVRMSSR